MYFYGACYEKQIGLFSATGNGASKFDRIKVPGSTNQIYGVNSFSQKIGHKYGSSNHLTL